ncbi:hypothetical protein L3Q82_006023 [Scortum barcoo]|uniref:Uncharacterized protein n=1 Tax=Scortum barcoo TaxID=214431 RepID=A0ACB8X2A5_9TELE|nr:hypothetical protein L3Q82_006023 [Scortum barcoo]
MTARLGAVEQPWFAQCASFNYNIRYRSGRSNVNAGALSRSPVEAPDTEPVDGEAVFTAAVELTPGEGGEEWADNVLPPTGEPSTETQRLAETRTLPAPLVYGFHLLLPILPMPPQGGELEAAPRRSPSNIRGRGESNIGRPPERKGFLKSIVVFSWKRQKEDGPLEELPPAEGEQLELRESGRTAAILLIRQPESSTYKYRCYVQHEGGTVEAPTEQELPAPAASCPPEREPADLPALQQADLSFQSQCRVKLLSLLYSVLIVKSLVYCCGLSLLRILRNKGPSTNCTHAD